MNISKIGTVVNTAGKKLAGAASDIGGKLNKKAGLRAANKMFPGAPIDDIAKMNASLEFKMGLVRDCARIYTKEKALEQKSTAVQKSFIGKAKQAAGELLNLAAQKLSSAFKK